MQPVSGHAIRISSINGLVTCDRLQLAKRLRNPRDLRVSYSGKYCRFPPGRLRFDSGRTHFFLRSSRKYVWNPQLKFYFRTSRRKSKTCLSNDGSKTQSAAFRRFSSEVCITFHQSFLPQMSGCFND